jgi:hypothetical protein
MLENVDQIELSGRQKPRYAKPGEIAAALRALAFAESDDAAQVAYHRFLSAVGNDHDGSYFPVVLDAIPFLGEILTAGPRHARARSLDVLIDLVGSFWPDRAVQIDDGLRPEDLPAALRARVETLRPILQRLLVDSSAPDVQELAEELSQCLAKEG